MRTVCPHRTWNSPSFIPQIPAAITRAAAETWRGRKIPPHVHLSSPQLPWSTPGDHRPHAGWIDPADFPECWRDMDLTVDVEAKEKENAIAALRSALGPNF